MFFQRQRRRRLTIVNYPKRKVNACAACSDSRSDSSHMIKVRYQLCRLRGVAFSGGLRPAGSAAEYLCHLRGLRNWATEVNGEQSAGAQDCPQAVAGKL